MHPVRSVAQWADESHANARSCVPWRRVADVREELLATLTALADFAYGWGLLDAHVHRLQAAVSILPQTSWPVIEKSPAVTAISDMKLQKAQPDDAVSAWGASR